MLRSLLAGAALAAIVLPTTASASAIFDIQGTFADGGTFSGTITTSDNLATLEDFIINTTAGNGWPFPVFPATSYTKAAASSVTWSLPSAWLIANYAGGAALNFYFVPGSITQNGGTLAVSANETISQIGTRPVASGSMTRQVAAAVPEPATWALMILGFGLVGGAMRSSIRRQTVGVRYA